MLPGKGSRNQLFCRLDTIRKQSNFTVGSFNKSGKKNMVKLKVQLVKKEQSQMVRFHSLLRPSNFPLYVHVDHLFIQSSTDGHFGCFHILVVVNNTATNIGGHASFRISVLDVFRYTPRSGIAGS